MFIRHQVCLLLLVAFLFTGTAVSPKLAWGEIDSIAASSVSPNLGPYLNIWTDAKVNETNAVVYNSDYDEYLVVWSTLQDEFSSDIWARRIASDGRLLSWFCIANSDGERLSAWAAAYSTLQDRYIVVFSRPYVNDPNDLDLWAVTFDYDGTDLSDFRIVDYSTGYQSGSSVAYNSQADEFLVVYTNQDTGVCYEVVAQRIDAETGFTVDGRIPIGSCTAGHNRLIPDVAYNPTRNNYLIAYEYNEGPPYHQYIYAKTALNDLSVLSPEFQLSGDGAGGVSVAVGQDEYLAAFTISSSYIFARRVNYDGTLPVAGNGFQVSFITDYNSFVEVSASSQGYWLVWLREPNLSDTQDIYGNFVPMGADQALSVEFPIDVKENSQTAGHIACRWQGGCLVADSYNLEWPEGDYDIQGRLLYPFGLHLPLVIK